MAEDDDNTVMSRVLFFVPQPTRAYPTKSLPIVRVWAELYDRLAKDANARHAWRIVNLMPTRILAQSGSWDLAGGRHSDSQPASQS
jgi:hypothetical protein